MSKVRVEKVRELMKQEISDIILHDLKDPRIGFVTVTSVSCTEDLREAKIYVSVMGDEQSVRDTLAGLGRALGFVRREIGRRIRLRFTPEISFALDTSLEYSDRIRRILDTIHDEKDADAREESR
ncbi:30S ribosome-binding factor RbfA [Selenomonas sp. F0473]|uniref:30S ribosome-binding factor RbfA n=1 Tax=Selenomonas sp. F0473 TaxID=999423 RepID=UPI0025E8B397|nr:30S ribosome-binding factor RbfA [Selenomonas sp. F0473]